METGRGRYGLAWSAGALVVLAHHTGLLGTGGGPTGVARSAVVVAAVAAAGGHVAIPSSAARRAAAVVAGLVAVVVIPLPVGVGPVGPLQLDGVLLAAYRTVVTAVVVAVVGVGLASVWAWLVDRPARAAVERPPSPLLWARLAAPCWFVWSLHLLAFWPGVLSVDSVKQWHQVRTLELTDAHPALHTLAMWVVSRLWETPAAVAAVQIAAVGALVGVVLAAARRHGTPRPVVVGAAVLVAVLPATGQLAVTLWKDVAYAGTVLLVSHLVLQVVRSRGAWLDGWRGPVALGSALAATSLVHHGGRLVALVTLVALAVTHRDRWRALAGAGAVVALAWVGLHGLLLSRLDVVRDHPGTGQIAIHHLAAHLGAGTRTTAGERDVLAPVLPADWVYDCESHNRVVHSRLPGRAARWDALGDSSAALARTSLALFLRDPAVDVRHVACNSRVVWRVRGRPEGTQTDSGLALVDPDRPLTAENLHSIAGLGERLGIDVERDPLAPALTVPLARVVLRTEDPGLSWLFWRGPLALYALLGSVAVGVARTGERRLALVALPSLLVVAVLVVAAPAQDFRYMFPVYLVAAVLAGPLATTGHRRVVGPDPGPAPAELTSGVAS